MKGNMGSCTGAMKNHGREDLGEKKGGDLPANLKKS